VGTLPTYLGPKVDTLVLSDVLYYEADLASAWHVMRHIASTVIIRGPNKLQWIRWKSKRTPMQSHVPHFNPEHSYILSREYLEKRLRSVGFEDVRTIPAVALGAVSKRKKLMQSAAYAASKAVYAVSGRVTTPGMITIAQGE
jgi:hypothetical protein